jgi:hypothetical protein
LRLVVEPMSNPNKNKGSAFERLVVDYLAEVMEAERTIAGARIDKGDIWTPPPSAVWQCKNHQQLSIGSWLRETQHQQRNAGRFLHWLIVKNKGVTDPAEQFAICTLAQARTLTTLLTAP